MNNQSLHSEISIYVGKGASHSWTWFADIFEREGYYAVSFVDEEDVQEGALSCCDVFFISGGDTFAIAEGLGSKGAGEIKKFVSGGGTYIGSCAGAYLPLHSSLPPLNMFNYVGARITNLTRHLPEVKQKPEKFCTEYGCRYVFHPVREELTVKLTGWNDFQNELITAPLYGGPALTATADIEVLAEYDGFTAKTEFLIDEDIARQALIGKAAAVSKKYGKGRFYLFGPHFEHPNYPGANRVLFNILTDCNTQTCSAGKIPETIAAGYDQAPEKNKFLDFLSLLSNARIVALGLERAAYTWLIGKKVYDPEKIRVFLETMWQRARHINSKKWYTYIESGEIDELIRVCSEMLLVLKKLRGEAGKTLAADKTADRFFETLRVLTARFVSLYFRLQRNALGAQKGRLICTYTSRQPQHSIL